MNRGSGWPQTKHRWKLPDMAGWQSIARQYEISYTYETIDQQFLTYVGYSPLAVDHGNVLTEPFSFQPAPSRFGTQQVSLVFDGTNVLSERGFTILFEQDVDRFSAWKYRQIRDHSVMYDMGTWEFVVEEIGPDGPAYALQPVMSPVDWHTFPQPEGWHLLARSNGGDAVAHLARIRNLIAARRLFR